MSVHLVTGNDPVLRDDAVTALVDELLAGDDRSLTVEEFTVPGRGDTDEPVGRDDVVSAVLNAAASPPFMTSRRIVIVRDVGNLRAADAAPLVASLDDPLPTTELILVVGGGKTPDGLDKAARAHGTVTGPASEKTTDVLALELTTHDLDLTRDARDAIRAHVGDDAGLVPSLVVTLRAAHPPGTTLDVADVTPYLGEAGSIPVWDLTNAIERGDIPGALATVRRLLTVTSPRQPKPMHPLQITAMLHGHYRRLLRLDDPAVRTNEDAAAAIGGRTNPRAAGFRLRQARGLGTDGLRRAFDLLAQADLDLKGARAIPEDAVVELLVGRLAGLAPGGRRPPARSGRPSPRAS
jgi:DNA polymerase III subunit delta